MNLPLVRPVVLLICFALTPTFVQSQSTDQNPPGLEAKVDKIFEQYDKPTSPGCALAVIKDGAIIYKRGYGIANLDYDIAIKPDTPFHVASISKQFTAMAIVLLAKEGKLSLDDPVRKYIPELRDFGVPLTIRHLLNHTSGLRDQWELLIMSGWRLSEDVVRDEDVLNLVGKMKDLNFPPGERHLYSNTGYTLAAIIVGRVSGQSLREFTTAKIFQPLGMTRTFFRDDHAVIVKNQAYAYQGVAGGNFKLSVPNYDTVGASSLVTTVEDLARWDQNFYDKRIGGADWLEQMQTPGKLNSGMAMGYGLGLSIGQYKGLRVVEHSGADAGYRSQLMRFPEQRFSVACLCNLGSSAPGQLARKVADLYLADLLRAEATKEDSGSVNLSEQQLQGKAGMYWTTSTEELGTVTINEHKLFLAFDGNRSELIPLGDLRFQIRGFPGEVTFAPLVNHLQRMTILIEGRMPIVLEPLSAVKPSAEQIKEYTGNFLSEEIDSTYQLAIQDGKLFMNRRKYRPIELLPVGKDVFTVAGAGSVRFLRDAQHRINGMVYSRGRIKNFRFTKIG